MELDFLQPLSNEVVNFVEGLSSQHLGSKVVLHTESQFPDLDKVLIARKSKRAIGELEVCSHVFLQRTLRWRVRNGKQVEHELGNHIRRWKIRRLDLRGTRVDPHVIIAAALLLKLPCQ